MCIGPSCWICGEPDEVRHLRVAVRAAFFDQREALGLTSDQCHLLSVVAGEALLPEVLAILITSAERDSRLGRAERRLKELGEELLIRIEHDFTEHDKYGICLVQIPEMYRWDDVHSRDRIRLLHEGVEKIGVVLELSRNSWVARVQLEER